MKFKIRYADQIVGVFIVTALLSLIFVILMAGKSQRWFSRNYQFKTYAPSAAGLNKNMPVSYKGFTIGNIKTFKLTGDNQVEIIFTVYSEYRNRVKKGSLAELLISPIGLGNQFLFYSGLAVEELEEFGLVPMHNSPEGKELIAQGIGYIPPHEDSMAVLIGKATTILDDLHGILAEVNMGVAGNTRTTLGKTLTNIEEITRDLSSPGGITKLLSGEGDSIRSLEAAFVSLAGTLNHIERAASYVPKEMPRIMNLLSELRTTLQAAEDVLIALRNNPLLRNGIPEHAESDPSGAGPRDIRF